MEGFVEKCPQKKGLHNNNLCQSLLTKEEILGKKKDKEIIQTIYLLFIKIIKVYRITII